MAKQSKGCSRRDFFKTTGVAGLGAAIGFLGADAEDSDAAPGQQGQTIRVPTRQFGTTGQQVSSLSLGGMFDIPNNQLLLKQALRWGVTYWDTAHSYGNGRSEKGIGKYFRQHPQDRKRVFLVTKSGAWSVSGMSRQLETSLERMQTEYVDLFFVHGISGINEMDDDIQRWAEEAKASGKIRFMGFSTHSNMENCLLKAPSLGWIDGIMMTYNYRLMQTSKMRAAVTACTQAGIGLTAMKTQGGGSIKTDTATELKLAGRFLEKGYTDGQAKLKAVWENPQIASICSQMPNINLLSTNVAAAVNKTQLSAGDRHLLNTYASETSADYCTGCVAICESAIAESVPIGNIMRYLMYSHSYGDHQRGRTAFKRIPQHVRNQITRIDYTTAEKKCPQGMAIGRLMRRATEVFV